MPGRWASYMSRSSRIALTRRAWDTSAATDCPGAEARTGRRGGDLPVSEETGSWGAGVVLPGWAKDEGQNGAADHQLL